MSFLYATIIFTTVTQQSAIFAYLLDAHRNTSIETTVFVAIVQTFFSFAARKVLASMIEPFRRCGHNLCECPDIGCAGLDNDTPVRLWEGREECIAKMAVIDRECAK